ncbi:MAG: hypothetical protein J7J65_03310 [Candidatus Korarchaeota archaeon]|nr:hypothetical protein [Candidatus Korarchaeota archaeon]
MFNKEDLYFPAAVAILSIPLLLILQMGILNVVLYIVPVLASLILIIRWSHDLEIPIFQILGIVTIVLSIAGFVGLLRGLLGAVLSILIILLSGLGFASYLEGSFSEKLALSSVMGGLFTTILVFVAMLVNDKFPIKLITVIGAISGILTIYKHRRNKYKVRIDRYFLSLLLLVFFYLIELFAVFPGFFRLTTSDIVYHQRHAQMLVIAPRFYETWAYIGYHAILGTAFIIANPTSAELMYSSILINLFTLVYLFVAFSRLERRTEALTVWGLFSGFAWIAILKYGVDVRGLGLASLNSYKSLIWSNPLLLWGLPLTLAIGLLAFLLYQDIYFAESRNKLIYICLTFSLLFLVHVVEGALFIAYLLASTMFLNSKKYSSLGVIASELGLLLIYFLSSAKGYESGRAVLLLQIGIVAAGVSLLISLKRGVVGRFSNSIASFLGKRSKYISYSLLSLYLAGILVWYVHLGELDIQKIYNLGQVPWFFYPVLLGIGGALAILSLRIGFSKELALFILVSLIMGRFITYYKLFVDPGLNYWEFRFPIYAMIGVAALSSVLLGKLISNLGKEKKYAILLASIVLMGYYSMALSVQRWNHINTYNIGTVNQIDYDFASSVRFFSNNPNVPALVLTSYSLATAALAAPRITIKEIPSWVSSYPEVALLFLKPLSTSDRVAVLTTGADLFYLSSVNASDSYLLKYMGSIRKVPSLKVVELSNPPLPDADLAVVFPSDIYLRKKALIAYELIRGELPPHTTYLSDDPAVPSGIYIGADNGTVYIDEDIPESPYDLRWLYLSGNFTEGLRLGKGRHFAITSYELDEGVVNLSLCGYPEGWVSIIFSFKNLKNYNLVQLLLDKGVVVPRMVVNGNVSTGNPSKVPIGGQECTYFSISLVNGTVIATVNGKDVPVGVSKSLGVIGFEAQGFKGIIKGHVHGKHTLQWKVPAGSTLINVVGGEGIDLSKLVRIGEQDMDKAKMQYSAMKPLLPSLGPSPTRIVKPVYAALKMRANGTIYITGRPVWYEVNGTKRYLNESSINIEAQKLSFFEGHGFYITLYLEGVKKPSWGINKGLFTFRTPIKIQVEGELLLEEGHPFKAHVRAAETIKTRKATLSVIAADKAILFGKLNYEEVKIEKRGSYEYFNELAYWPETLASIVFFLSIILVIDRHYSKGYRAPRKPRRKKKGKSSK